MEPTVILIVLLIFGIPTVVGIWLIARAISARDQIENLTRRVDLLQREVERLRSPVPPAAGPSEETSASFVRATLPPRKEAAEPVPPPVIPPWTPAPPKAPAPPAPAPVLAEPVVTFPAEPPPMIPPVPPITPGEPPPRPVAEPVFETATADAAAPQAAGETNGKDSFEMRVGKFWAVRIGIVVILTALAFGANLAYHNIVPRLGAGAKVGLLYLASVGLLGAGAWWQRRNVKESLKNYAQVLFAGGLAAVYFTTYAAHYAPPVRVIASPLLDGTLLLVWAGFIAGIADRRKSEVMALFAVGLAFFTSVITRVGEFTLYSNLVLTLAAVVFLVRNRWAGLSFASLVASYAGYAFWRFLHPNGWHWAAPDENLWLGAGFLAAYWTVFTAAAFLSRSERLSGPNRAAFVTLNNGAYFSLFLLTMLQVHSGGFWKFSLVYGLVLLGLAALGWRFLRVEALTRNAYLAQGLVLVTLGFIARFSGLQLALILGAESVVLYVSGAERRSRVATVFAYATAVLAVAWCRLVWEEAGTEGLWTGSAVGALLLFNAVWAHRQQRDNPRPLRGEPAAFTLLALAAWLMTTWANTGLEHLPLMLAAEAVALTLSIYLLRVREITFLGQGFLWLAQGVWLFHFLTITPPWWNPLLLVAVTLGLSHWWQHQKTVAVPPNVYGVGSAVLAVAAVGVTLVWLQPLVSAGSWLAVASLLAVAVTGYGLVTRAWALAICGQIFLAAGVEQCVVQFFHGQPAWYFPLAPMAVLAAFSLGTLAWFARESQASTAARGPLLQVALIYRWVALFLSLVWVWDYVPARQRVGAAMLAAALVFAVAGWRRSREALIAAAVYAGVSVALLWLVEDLRMDIYGPNLLALLALLAMQHILRRRAASLPIPEAAHGVVVLVAGLSLWRFLSCWTSLAASGFLVTMTWAGFAVVMFAAGLLLPERFLRWFGLGVLAAAVGRVVLVDVWKQETGYRVLTFLALGVALLLVGFVYNKYQEKIRRWL